MAAQELVEANDEQRDEARPQLDPEKLDALAAALERSASWFPAPAEQDRAPASEGAVALSSELEASAAAPESRVRASSRPLGKKERRELERKQAVLAAQRANEQRREKRRKRERLRTERLAARKQERKPPAPPKVAAAKVAPRAATSEAATPAQPPQRGWLATVRAWLARKR